MRAAIARARRRPDLAAPSIDSLAVGLVDVLGPLYVRHALRIRSLSFAEGERFVEAVREFYDGVSRLIIAFRHAYGDEPEVLTYAMHRGLPREAKRSGKPLACRPHCTFLHGYEVPLWSGPLVRWLLPRIGAMPVYHVRADGSGLRKIRAAVLDGAHPLALAPEGQVSYRSESLPRLERGALQLGFWCAEELENAERPERVLILPVSVHSRFNESDIGALEVLAKDLESRAGLPSPAGRTGPTVDPAARRRLLGLRLRHIDLALLGIAEGFYGLRPARREAQSVQQDANSDVGPAFIAGRESRRLAILHEALRRGEAALGLRPVGDMINRVYAIRHEGWNRIFPEKDPGSLPPLQRALADRRAGEAWYAMRHMELVDLGFYLDAAYLEDGLHDGGSPSIGRLAETAVNLADFASRLTGGAFSDRPKPLDKRVVLVCEPPLEMRSRLAEYKSDRRGALARAEADLARAYTTAIKEHIDDTD